MLSKSLVILRLYWRITVNVPAGFTHGIHCNPFWWILQPICSLLEHRNPRLYTVHIIPFICGQLDDAIYSFEWKNKSEQWSAMDVVGRDNVDPDIIPVFPWRDWGKRRAPQSGELVSRPCHQLGRIFIFWDITPCSRLKVNRRFGGTCRLYFQGQGISQASR
jgi:hypothetical protein